MRRRWGAGQPDAGPDDDRAGKHRRPHADGHHQADAYAVHCAPPGAPSATTSRTPIRSAGFGPTGSSTIRPGTGRTRAPVHGPGRLRSRGRTTADPRLTEVQGGALPSDAATMHDPYSRATSLPVSSQPAVGDDSAPRGSSAEGRLLAQARGGSRSAVDVLFARYGSWLRRGAACHQRERRPRPQVTAKAIHGEVRVTLGGTHLDEWHQWRRPLRPRTTGCRLAAGTITRSGCRRDVGSPRLLGSVSAGRVSASSRDGCSVFDSSTSLHSERGCWRRTDRR